VKIGETATSELRVYASPVWVEISDEEAGLTVPREKNISITPTATTASGGSRNPEKQPPPEEEAVAATEGE
jgi:hypothetical protein